MYSAGLSYRYRHQEEAASRRPWHGWNDGDAMAAAQPEVPSRRRYARSSTSSVAQLLSESCTSLLQKLTTKVRGPSASVETTRVKDNNFNPLTTSKSTTSVSSFGKSAISNLGMTRTRLEDKYSNVLEKIYGRKRDPERTIEPSVGRTLSKSATTTNVILSEKAYPYVNNATREKTPYRSDRIGHHYRKQYAMELPYAYLDQESASRLRHRSNHSELRPRRSSKPSSRAGKSEASDRSAFRLYPVEIPLVDDAPVPVHKRLGGGVDDDATPTPGNSVPDAVTEREAKRKEIQSLIMKYSALDEVYNRGASGVTATAAVAVPKQNAVSVKKYYPAAARMVAVVSRGRV